MRTVTSTYRQIIASGNTRNFHVKIDMTLANENELTFTDAEIMDGSFKIETASSGNSSFDIGSAIIGMCKFSLMNLDDRYTRIDFFNATAVVWVKLEGDSEWIRVGFYTVDEPVYAGSVVQIEMLDNMWKFDVPLPTVVMPRSLRDCINTVCRHCGVQLATQTFHGYDYILTELPDNVDMNCREFIQYIAMIGCNFCVIDDQGQLCLKWYDLESRPSDFLDGGTFSTTTTPYSDGDIADGGNFINYNSGDDYDGGTFIESETVSWFTRNFSATVGTDEITITGIRFTINNVEYTIGGGDYILSLENPLVTENNVNEVLNLIWDVINGMKLRTFKVNSLPDISCEVGDCCAVKTAKGHIVYSFITSNTFNLSSQAVECNAVSPTRELTTRYSKAVQQSVEKAKKEADKAITDYDEAVQLMNNLAINAIGAYQDYEDLDTGGRVYYLSNKPITKVDGHCTFVANSTVFKATGDGFFVSTDGGQTFVNGYSGGQLVVNVLNAIGISAQWIKTGTLEIGGNGTNAVIIVYNAQGSPICYIDNRGITMYRGRIQSADGTQYLDLTNNEFQLTGATKVGNDSLTTIFSQIQGQIDGKAETWYQSSDPSTAWTTTALKEAHIGDLWYRTTDNTTWIYRKENGSYLWKQENVPNDVFDKIDGKCQVFVSQPVPPYHLHDLWFQGTSGDILTCINTRTTGSYVASDWAKKNKYTDDTAVTALNNALNYEGVFIRLTDNGRIQGLYMANDELYVNAQYIGAGEITIGGQYYNTNPSLKIKSNVAPYNTIGTWTKDGITVNKGTFGLLTIEADSSSIKAVGTRYMRKFVIPYSTKQRSRTYRFVIGAKYFVDNFTLHFSKPDIIRGPVESGNYIGQVGVSGMQYNSSTGKWEATYFFGGIVFTDQDTIGDILVDWKTRGFSETDKISIDFANWPTNPCKFSVETTVLNTTTLLLSASRNIGEFSGGFRGTFDGSVNDWSWDDDSSQMQVQTNSYTNYYSTTGFGLGFKEYSGDTQSVLRWLPEDGRLLLRSNRNTSDERGIIVSNYNPSDNDSNDFSGSGCYYTINKPTSFLAKKTGSNNYGSLEYDKLMIGDNSSYSSKVKKDRVEVGSGSDYARLEKGGLTITDSSDTAILNGEQILVSTYGTSSTMKSTSEESELYLNHGNGRLILATANSGEATIRVADDFDDGRYLYIVSNSSTQNVVKVEGGHAYSVEWNTSDKRVKEDIEELDTDLSLNLIDATETKRFKYKGAEGTHYGMIAQDARELLDNLGETDAQLEHSMHIDVSEIDDQRTIDYHEYIPHLINYVKELRAELNQVKAELRELKGE